MNKISAFFILRGKSIGENFLICKEKTRYAFGRIMSILFKKTPFTMGEGLSSSVNAKNSYGIFFCRRRSADLHIISDSYEFNVRVLFEKIASKSRIILDVGANVGKYAILACKSNPDSRVFAFEPSGSNFYILRINKELNKCKNLNLCKIGLSDKKGKMKLYDGLGTGSFSLKVKSQKFEEVTTDKLDNLFKEIDLIKIDVEGAELDVLNGAKKLLSKKKIKNLIVELDKENEKKIIELMRNFGYRVKKIQYNNFLFYL